jgi:antitoxin CptB
LADDGAGRNRVRKVADSGPPARYRTAPGPVRVFAVGETMSEAKLANESLELRRRKLRFRAWHRGTREMDLVLGRFVDAELNDLSEQELAKLEALMEAPDPDLFAWVLGQSEVPPEHDTPIFRRLAEFNRAGKGSPKQ